MNAKLARPLLPAALALAACAPADPPPPSPRPVAVTDPAAVADSAAARVTRIADEYVAALLERTPEIATYYGIEGMRHDRVTDNSLAARRAWEAREDAFLARARQVDPAPLAGRPEWVTAGFLRETLEASVQRRVCREELWPVSQMSGWQTIYPYVAQIQPVGTEEARRQALARWRALPGYLDTEVASLREGVRRGYTSPRIAVERVIAQVEGLLRPPPAESPLAAPARRDSTPAFRAELERAVAEEVNPAVRRYLDFLRGEYLPAAREATAVSANPDGAACYRALVRGYTTLDLPPEEIHETGLRQMEQIQREMGEIARRSFGTDDVRALLERFRTDPRYTFRTRREMEDYAVAALARAREEMPRWFGTLPKADVVVEPYPAFQEASAPGGEYNPPSDDGSRPGVYRIRTYQPERQSRVGQESTAFHETIPGHHLQVAIAQERTGAHPLTRYVFNSGFTEGWALYAERLADEMGLFSSDLDRMGLLSNEALRAARLVVDPGLHVLGWTREQAIDYMLRHTAESADGVAVEVDRYIVLPGQATAYMIGSLEIARLRARAERELGGEFDVREFHDRVLENGSVTLPMLRENVERWIAARKAR